MENIFLIKGYGSEFDKKEKHLNMINEIYLKLNPTSSLMQNTVEFLFK